jgi:hypothetical protein
MATFYVQISEEEQSDEVTFGSEEYQEMVDGGILTEDSRACATSLPSTAPAAAPSRHAR